MQRALRKQGDTLGKAYSELTAYQTVGPDMARQEFREEADINTILRKFGATAQQRQGVWGSTIDYNIDLQTALDATHDAQLAYQQLPEKLRQRYPTLDEFMAAANAGNIQPADLKPAAPAAPAPPTTP